MANVGEKARFYLERTVPQLRELEEKQIFSKDEIRSLVHKRTEFEHLVLSPGCKPSDFLSYIAWDESLEKLRAKRCRRFKVRNSSNHAGQARVFQTFERAVARHPGSVLLWRRYLDYAAGVKATKRWRKIMTRALRMHPAEAGLWVLAGRKAASDGDMESARAMFMRGCRFCTRDETVWVEYARAEMEWLARMERKKGTAELIVAAQPHAADEEEDGVITFEEEEDDDAEDDLGDEGTILPGALAGREADNKKPLVFGDEAIRKLEKSPAMDGAIPRAIFDISRKQAFYGPRAAEAFFDMFATFLTVTAMPGILQHVVDAMVASDPNDPSTCSCLVRQPLVGVDTNTAAFPKALRETLMKLKKAMEITSDKAVLIEKTANWIDLVLSRSDLDGGIQRVLEYTKRSLEAS